MKNILSIIFIITLRLQLNAQVEIEPSYQWDNAINSNYLEMVQDETTPEDVKIIEDQVFRYDVTISKMFDGRSEPFKAVFRSTKGSIIVTYDKRGEVLSSLEKFKDVILPESIKHYVLKKYPNWSLLNDTYYVSYIRGKNIKKSYKIKIGKDNLKKNLKLDVSGNIVAFNINK